MKTNKKSIVTIGLILFLVSYIYIMLPLAVSWGPGTNYRNYSVRTTVNVTQSYPEILNITCNSGTTLTLTPGATKNMNCTISIRDFNGGNTINNTNGTFYFYLNQSSDPNDNNTHYSNATCTGGTPDGYNVTWTCAFDVLYYANNGSWRANFTVKDSHNMTASNYVNVSISSLYALNVTSPIDFGNMAVGDTTITSVQANITNFGNMNINVSIYGFGGEDPVAGNGLAMICDVRNITLPNERFALSSATAYDSMTPVTDTATHIPALTVSQQLDDSLLVINSTYWRLHVNISSNPFGVCNGTVVFSAEAP